MKQSMSAEDCNIRQKAGEIETAALYMNAAGAGKKAVTILFISDLKFKKKFLTPQERQAGFTR